MKRLVLITLALVAPAGAWAQGVNDPSTPNNIPSRIEAPVTSGAAARPYRGNMTRGSGSGRRY
jgi:hypothetical protein